MTSVSARAELKATSIHWFFSCALPSCQLVLGSPSMAFPAWYLGRPPSTDDAVAPVRVSAEAAPGDAAAADALDPGVALPAAADDGAPDCPAAVSGGLPRRASPANTIATPTSRPTTAMPAIGEMPRPPPGRPRADVVAPVIGDGGGVGVQATAAATLSGSGSSTLAAAASVVPHDWQNVRFDGLAIPHAGHRTSGPSGTPSPSSSYVSGSGSAGRTGFGIGSPYGAPHAADAGAAPAAPATAGSGVAGGAPPLGSPPAAEASAGWPSHSRNAPHDPQNWSPGTLAKPHRLQIVRGSSVIGRSSLGSRARVGGRSGGG